MATPISPITTPARRRAESRSSPAAAITSTVNTGVVALRIEASPLEMNVCPVTIRQEWQDVVERRDGEEWPPARNPLRESDAIDKQQRQQQDRRERYPQQHDRQRRQFADRHTDKKERAAPQHRQTAPSSDQSLMWMRWSVDVTAVGGPRDRAHRLARKPALRPPGFPQSRGTPRAPASYLSVGPVRDAGAAGSSLALGLAQTQAYGRRRRAFCAVRPAAAGAERRHQRLVRLATHRAVRLNRPQTSRVTLVAFVALGTGLALGSGAPPLAPPHPWRRPRPWRQPHPWPSTPLAPASPWRRRFALVALLILGAGGPASALSPARTCAPCAPCGPGGPCSPFGPGSRPQAASESAIPTRRT